MLSRNYHCAKGSQSTGSQKMAPAHSHCVRRNKAADDDAAAVMHIPHHGFADRIAAVADNGALGHRHPLAFDRHPIGACAYIVFGAMAVRDVAAGDAVRGDHALEPGADVGRDVLVLAVVERERRARQRGQTRQQGDLRESSHAILHSVAFASSLRASAARDESLRLSRLSRSYRADACSKNMRRSRAAKLMRCEITASTFDVLSTAPSARCWSMR